MDTTSRVAIEAQCRDLVIAFGHHLDDSDGHAAGRLFTSDGVWDRPGTQIVGPDAVAAVIHQRAPSLVTRHVFTNILVKVIDDDHAESRAYYIVFRDDGRGEAGERLPRPLPAPDRMGDYLSQFVRTDQGWRIAYHTAKRIFERVE